MDIANPTFNSNVISDLIYNGHIWIGVGILLLQLILIPTFSRLFRHYSEIQKRQIDAERKVTKIERDVQMERFGNRIEDIDRNHRRDYQSLQDSHQSDYLKLMEKHQSDYERMNEAINGVKKAIDKFEVKLDKLVDKLSRDCSYN